MQHSPGTKQSKVSKADLKPKSKSGYESYKCHQKYMMRPTGRKEH